MAEYDDLPAMLKVAEVKVLLQVERATVYKLVERGVIPCVRFGKIIRIPKAAILAMLQAPAPLRKRRPPSRDLDGWVEHIAAKVDDE